MTQTAYVFPLSFAQQRLWFLDQFEPGSALYNIPTTFRLLGELNLPALEASLAALVDRHEILRTNFTVQDGQPCQIIAPARTIELAFSDLSKLSLEEATAAAHELARQVAEQPFDLTKDSLLRVQVVRLNSAEHWLSLNFHHIIFDSWSMGVFTQELSALYQAHLSGQPAELPELAIQYADFAVWQREWLQGEVLDTQLNYWRKQLADLPELLELPTDFPRPATQTFRGAYEYLELPAALNQKIKQLSQRENSTAYMTLLTAFQILLSRYSRQEDLAIGTPIANRSQAETEALIGFFVNTLVIRGDLSGNPDFRTLLAKTRQTTLEAFAHQDLPFERLVEELKPQRELSYTPFFQVMFSVHGATNGAGFTLPGLKVESVEGLAAATSKYDLSFELTDEADGSLGCLVEYNLDLFEKATVERLLQHWAILLENIVQNPAKPINSLSILTTADKKFWLDYNQETITDYPAECTIQNLFEAQVAQTPAAIALEFAAEQLSYVELNQRANRLAHYLREAGVKQETLVGVCLERSLEQIVALLAILKAGGAYVPLDPTYPQERLAFMLADSQVSLVITTEQLAKNLDTGNLQTIYLDGQWDAQQFAYSAENPSEISGSRNLAYMTYTSGSTGKPKAAEISQQGVVRLVKATNYLQFASEQVFLQFAPVAFDASTLEIWGSLLNGAKLVIMPPQLPSLEELGEFIETKGVTVLWLTAGLFQQMVDSQLARLKDVRYLLAGGDVLSVAHVARVLQELPACRLINGYGPTENTTFTCCYQIKAVSDQVKAIPIGQPISNTQVFILDKNLQLVPPGVAGELYTGGAGLARGYYRRPALTAEKFVPHPFSSEPGARLYRTGDLARLRSDGAIEFLGRLDNQLKLRGFRIEPGEIEAALLRHPAVQQAAVIVQQLKQGDKRLVAYLTGKPAETDATEPDLRGFLKEFLPPYMIPTAFVWLESLPLTTNGKLDRRALPIPEIRNDLPETASVPHSPLEQELVNLWADVLGLNPPQISRHANFFELGGHSLLAAQLLSKINTLWGIKLSLRVLFEAATIAELAVRLETLRQAPGKSADTQSQSLPGISRRADPTQNLFPLSHAQQRVWFFDQLKPGNPFYNIPLALKLKGALNVAALEKSLNRLIERHEILRTNFVTQAGQPFQLVHPTRALELGIKDLSGLSESVRQHQADQLVEQEALLPFDLSSDLLLRAGLLKLGSDSYLLLLTFHHIITDGWSMGIFTHELSQCYQAECAGLEPQLAELPIQYADYALWQRERLQGETLEQMLNYWRQHMAGAPQVLELPTDFARPAVMSYRGAHYKLELGLELASKLKKFNQQAGVTNFMTLLTAFKLLLSRYSGQEDIVIGTPIANRTQPETAGLLGFFSNTVVMRTDLSGNPSFSQLLKRVQNTVLETDAQQELPFERLVEELQPERQSSHSPIFQVMFSLYPATGAEYGLAGLELEAIEGTEGKTSKCDLSLILNDTPEGGLAGFIEYSTDLFEETTIARFAQHWQTLLANILENPHEPISALEMISQTELAELENWGLAYETSDI